ncbi:SH3 domain-containing protein [Agrobacterium tumefaciens]|uniref:SH3 domain-containing protein n=1 Tax=Agrobacterium tumefaciens TaxID=358 RepID=UPI001FDAACAC|nr:SH3 domain-containing protein [Agrobacterium tumefaciens]
MAPTTTASEADPADGQKIEKREPVQNYPTRFVAGNRVAFRSGPSTGDTIIDRFDHGRQVLLIEESGEWSHIKDQLTQRDGWIASRFLAGRPKPRDEKPSDKGTKNTAREGPVPSVPDSMIIQRIIAESLASYPGSCACPYNTDRGGRRCGKRSAYSKPGGYAPICYPQDVTKAMIDAFRRQ